MPFLEVVFAGSSLVGILYSCSTLSKMMVAFGFYIFWVLSSSRICFLICCMVYFSDIGNMSIVTTVATVFLYNHIRSHKKILTVFYHYSFTQSFKVG